MLKDLVFWHSKLRHCLCCWHLILEGQFWFSCLPDVPGKATNDGLNLWALATHMEFQVPRFSLAQQPLEDWTSGWKITSLLSGLKINILKIYMLGNKFSHSQNSWEPPSSWNKLRKIYKVGGFPLTSWLPDLLQSYDNQNSVALEEERHLNQWKGIRSNQVLALMVSWFSTWEQRLFSGGTSDNLLNRSAYKTGSPHTKEWR